MNREKKLAIYEQAKTWTIEAGKALKASLKESIVVEYKTSAADLVTEKDKEIEQFFVEKISKTFPEHYILGEEGMAQKQEFVPEAETLWIIDPIDGTTNFVHQKRDFAISVGVFVEGKPVIGIIYDPIQDECYHACQGEGAFLNEERLSPLADKNIEEALLSLDPLWLTANDIFDYARCQAIVRHARGARSIGSAALELAYVACGRFDGYFSLRLSPWDYAAGIVILEEVGAKLTTVANEPLSISTKRSTVFVASPKLHEALLKGFILSEDIPAYKTEI